MRNIGIMGIVIEGKFRVEIESLCYAPSHSNSVAAGRKLIGFDST